MSFMRYVPALGVTAFVLIIVAAPLFRAGASLAVAFGALGIGAFLGGLVAIVAAIGLLWAWQGGPPASPAFVVGGVLGLIAFAIPAQRLWAARGLPVIHDISTDRNDPPAFRAVVPRRGADANPLTFSSEVAAEQARGYPDIGPVTLALPPAAAFAKALGAARDAGWEIVASDEATGRIEATDTTRWFGFKDDVSVRLSPVAGGTRVDVRSVSRVGRGDLGTNAARIRAYLGSLTGN
jgi:uncharacterized protein (DUF1499 family)